MAEIKVNIGTKSGKSYQKAFDSSKFTNKKIGDTISGDLVNIQGAELQITGGSDNSGFPMRPDLPGTLKRKLLVTRGMGYREKIKGKRTKKMFATNQITEKTAQINLKIIKEGSQSLEQAWELVKTELAKEAETTQPIKVKEEPKVEAKKTTEAKKETKVEKAKSVETKPEKTKTE